MQNQSKQKSKKDNKIKEYEQSILDYLKKNPSGLTITDVKNGIGVSRITITKYISLLELKGKVFSKKIGAYKLFFSSERSFLPKKTMISFYNALLSSLKNEFPDNKKFKELGYNIANFMDFTYGESYLEGILPSKKGSSKVLLKYIAELYPYLDVLQDKSDVPEVKINEEGNKAIYRFKNSRFLDDPDIFALHINLVTGILENVLTKRLKKEAICKIDKEYITDKSEDSFIEISIEIP